MRSEYKWRGNHRLMVQMPVFIEAETDAGKRQAIAELKRGLFYACGCIGGADSFRIRTGKVTVVKPVTTTSAGNGGSK